MASLGGVVGLLFHVVMALFYGLTIKVYLLDLDPPEYMKKVNDVWGGPFKYLTFWDMLVQFTYFSIAVLADGCGGRLRRVRDFYFATVVFWMGTLVSIGFWTLYAMDRKMIFPEQLDEWFPNWLNHGIHSAPVVCVLLETVIVRHRLPSKRVSLTGVAVTCLAYLVWVLYIAYHTGFWVYPILQKLPMYGRAAFISTNTAISCGAALAGRALHRLRWGEEVKMKLP